MTTYALEADHETAVVFVVGVGAEERQHHVHCDSNEKRSDATCVAVSGRAKSYTVDMRADDSYRRKGCS